LAKKKEILISAESLHKLSSKQAALEGLLLLLTAGVTPCWSRYVYCAADCWGYPVLARISTAAAALLGMPRVGSMMGYVFVFCCFWPARHNAHAAQKKTPRPQRVRGRVQKNRERFAPFEREGGLSADPQFIKAQRCAMGGYGDFWVSGGRIPL
jgi:hypothetical protein